MYIYKFYNLPWYIQIFINNLCTYLTLSLQICKDQEVINQFIAIYQNLFKKKNHKKDCISKPKI